MRIGTRSLLFGLHQFFIHPLLVLFAFIKLYKRLPNLMEFVCIAIHDLGYFGQGGIDSQGGERHPYLGAHIARVLFGEEGWQFVIGHNDDTARWENIPRSPLFYADKYYYVLIPLWLHYLLGRLSGEYKEIAQREGEFRPSQYKAFVTAMFASFSILPQ